MSSSIPEKYQIRFQGDFGPDSGLRFVDVENSDGEGIRIGEWEQDGDDWLLKVGEEDE